KSLIAIWAVRALFTTLVALLAIAGCASTKPPLETGVQCMAPIGADPYSRECKAWRIGPTQREQLRRQQPAPAQPRRPHDGKDWT
ncbi:MAG TPA: hypothetical protein VD932_06710, partial [Aquabacterium sp.]|nr:hypothetical protein [Aquabacterium sp.]